MDGFKRQNGQQFNSQPNNNRQVPPLGAAPRPAPRAIDPNQPMEQKADIPLNSDNDAMNHDVSKKKRRLRRWMIILIAIMMFLAAVFAALFKWYEMQLKPVSSDNNKVSVTVEDGSSVSVVANTLASKNLIRNRLAFEVYVRLNNKNSIKAGTCMIAPSESVADIVDKTSVRYILRQAGYSDDEISNAFKAKYDSPLFADRPSGSSLEGYVFGETYQFTGDATAKDVLQTVFDHMYKVVQKNDLVNKFKAQGLTLYQGLTMASIVERELGCEDKPTVERKNRCYQYQRGIAQVFIARYKKNMQLGSDVTFIYAADKAGVKPKVDIDSPYNTRKHTGLPPTPIATPGELSLKAVADPAPGDNLFFIAGDDGLIYFAKTDEEHKNNIDKYCQKLCSIV